MADTTTTVPTTEMTADTTTTTPTADSVASISQDKPVEKKDDVVPLSAHLELKRELKEMKQALANVNPQNKSEVNATVASFIEKYPDTDPNAIAEIINIAVKTVDAKYSPILQKQEEAQKQADFDQKFTEIFDKATDEFPQLKGKVDKNLIKTLALTPTYNNMPVADIIKTIYPDHAVSRATSENDARVTTDTIETIVDLNAITPEQRSRIMDDPVARKAYFDRLDAQGK